MRIIADTGAVYALMDKDDKWHSEVKRILEEEKLERHQRRIERLKEAALPVPADHLLWACGSRPGTRR